MEYVVLAPDGGVLAGPFADEDDARRWVVSYLGQVALSRWGRLYVAERLRRDNGGAVCVASWQDQADVPDSVWSLQRSGDLVVVRTECGLEAWA